MAAILEFDNNVAGSIRSVLGSAAIVINDASMVAAHVHENNDPLVVIGPSVDANVARRVSEQIAAEHPASGVIWLRRRVDTSTVLEAIRAGASDVVGENDLPALICAARRVISRAAAFAVRSGRTNEAGRGVVTAIFAPKGGCGKTSIATNMAALIASEHKQRVALIDLDLESGDVQLLMSLPQGRSITDLTGMADSLDTSALGATMIPHSSGAYILAAPRRPEEAPMISTSLIARVIEVAASIFDHVIVDCPPYATEHVLTVLDAADHLALVCMPDAASVKNTAVAMDMLRELNFTGRISLMLNHAGDKVGITAADIAHALNTRIECEIPSSLDLPTATNKGNLLTMTQPRHPISTAIRSWATLISPGTPAPPAEVEEAAAEVVPMKRSRFSFKKVATV